MDYRGYGRIDSMGESGGWNYETAAKRTPSSGRRNGNRHFSNQNGSTKRRVSSQSHGHANAAASSRLSPALNRAQSNIPPRLQVTVVDEVDPSLLTPKVVNAPASAARNGNLGSSKNRRSIENIGSPQTVLTPIQRIVATIYGQYVIVRVPYDIAFRAKLAEQRAMIEAKKCYWRAVAARRQELGSPIPFDLDASSVEMNEQDSNAFEYSDAFEDSDVFDDSDDSDLYPPPREPEVYPSFTVCPDSPSPPPHQQSFGNRNPFSTPSPSRPRTDVTKSAPLHRQAAAASSKSAIFGGRRSRHESF